MVSHQPIDSVMIGCLPAIRFFACAVWNGSARHSVTAPYPFEHVLAAGRLRPRRKPERKLFYMVSVPYPPGKVKQKPSKVPISLGFFPFQFYGNKSQFYGLFVLIVIIFAAFFHRIHDDEPPYAEHCPADK